MEELKSVTNISANDYKSLRMVQDMILRLRNQGEDQLPSEPIVSKATLETTAIAVTDFANFSTTDTPVVTSDLPSDTFFSLAAIYLAFVVILGVAFNTMAIFLFAKVQTVSTVQTFFSAPV